MRSLLSADMYISNLYRTGKISEAECARAMDLINRVFFGQSLYIELQRERKLPSQD